MKTLKHTSTYTIPERGEWKRGRDKHEHASIRIPQNEIIVAHMCCTRQQNQQADSIERETVSMGVAPES